jgi:hypothetical protein
MIPKRFAEEKKISWEQYTDLTKKIRELVYITLDSLNDASVEEKSPLKLVQETILKQVGELLQQEHRLELEQEDEAIISDFVSPIQHSLVL